MSEDRQGRTTGDSTKILYCSFCGKSQHEVRKLIAAGRDPRYLMPDGVREIIEQTGCYRSKR